VSFPPPTDIPTDSDVSDRVISIDSHLTRPPNNGAGIDPTCPTPHRHPSRASSCPNIRAAGDPARPNARANTSTPFSTYCAPDVRGGTSHTTSP
jgi:hypothetical protein